MTYNDKEIFEGSFNLKNPGNNTMHCFFYSNISEYPGNLDGMLDDGKYKTTIHNIYKLGWKAQ